MWESIHTDSDIGAFGCVIHGNCSEKGGMARYFRLINSG